MQEQPLTTDFLSDVIHGLRQSPKRLPCKYFYDDRGSRLFEQICELDEYYLTRTEMAIMREDVGEMASALGTGVRLVEFGSGSSIKTRLLLEQLEQPTAYIPVDISKDHLHETARELATTFPAVEVIPICADFAHPIELPDVVGTQHTVVYFPGSTMGNFGPAAAEQLLDHIAAICGPGGGLLIGIDLEKDTKVLEAAYNDAKGVTSDFNLNLLARINRELNADFNLDQFRHQAEYKTRDGRIEMYLISTTRQTVVVGGESFTFDEGERICTEHSHKYTVDGFVEMAGRFGFTLNHQWTDAKHWFAVLHFRACA